MPTLLNIAISLVASVVIFVGGMNLPASNFSLKSFTDPFFGAFTEISTATNLADFPATYNANLNKTIEVGTTSVASITTLANLVTVGTLTSGALSTGFTAVPVALGGTGTTSPTSNQVMLGDTTNGFKAVSGFGTSGQFLTSNGAATAPTWQSSSVDQTISYNFTGSAFRVKNLHASSTAANPIVLNGLSLSTPSAIAASSTVLATDATGNLSFMKAPLILVQDSTSPTGSPSATTSVRTLVIPPSSIGTNGMFRFNVYFESSTIVGFQWGSVSFGNGTASTTIGLVLVNNSSNPAPTPTTASISGTIRNINSASVQSIGSVPMFTCPHSDCTKSQNAQIATSTTYNTAATTYLSVDLMSPSDTVTVKGFTLEAIQ